MKLPKLKMPKIPMLFWIAVLGLVTAVFTPRVFVVPVFYTLTIGPSVYGIHRLFQNASLAKAKRAEDKLANETPDPVVSE